MPISTVVQMTPVEDSLLRPTMGKYAHAAFFALLQQGDPACAEKVHAIQGLKPFTVSPLQGKFGKRGQQLTLKASEEYWFRVTFLQDDVFTAFSRAFLSFPIPHVRLGQCAFEVVRLMSTGGKEGKGEGGWAGHVSYSQLMEKAQEETRIHLRFYSPTAFRERVVSGEKPRNLPHPDPLRCYQSWVRKWNAFAPVPLDEARLLDFVAGQVYVTAVEMESHILDYGEHKQVGFTGSVALELLDDRREGGMENAECGAPSAEEQQREEMSLLRQVNLLADFAFYCGTGYKTTQGMGQTMRKR